MKRIAVLIAIVLLAGVAGGIYWFDSTTIDRQVASRWLLRSLADVKSIHVQTGEGTYTLSRVGDGWEAQMPGVSWNIKARVLPTKVEDYLSLIAKLEPQHSTGGYNRGGPDEYGLDNPLLKIILQFDEKVGRSLTIKFRADEIGGVYGWNSEDPAMVYVFGKDLLETLNVQVDHFLDMRVFNFDKKQIDRVQLVQPFGSSWLVQKGEKGFSFTLPGYLKGKDASDSEISLYIHTLALLKAGKLLLKPESSEQVPALTIRLWDVGGVEPHQVEFFTLPEDTTNYLGKSSWLTVPFLLDSESVAQLVRSAFDVQGRQVFNLDMSEVVYFIIFHGDKRYVVKRSDNGWLLRGEEKLLPGIDMSLWRFTELQFEALPLNNLSATAVKLMRCRLLDSNKGLLKEVTFFADPKLPQGQCWMKNGDEMYYPVSSRLLKDLQGMFPAGMSGNKEK